MRALLVALPTLLALAAPPLPATVAVDGRPLVRNGAGVRTKTFLRIEVYVAVLYLASKERDAARLLAADAPRSLVLHLTHDAPRGRLVDELEDGVARNARGELPALRERLDRLLAAIPDLVSGQTVTLTYVPGRGTTLAASGGGSATVPGKDLADALFRAWLGPDPLDADLKRALLGGGG